MRQITKVITLWPINYADRSHGNQLRNNNLIQLSIVQHIIHPHSLTTEWNGVESVAPNLIYHVAWEVTLSPNKYYQSVVVRVNLVPVHHQCQGIISDLVINCAHLRNQSKSDWWAHFRCLPGCLVGFGTNDDWNSFSLYLTSHHIALRVEQALYNPRPN